MDRHHPEDRRLVSRTAGATLLVTCLFLPGCATGYGIPQASPADIPELEAERQDAPERLSVLVRLGAAYRADARVSDAARVLEEARNLAPESPGAALLLGLSYEDLGRWSDARQLYEAYLELVPDSEIEDHLRGRIRLAERREIEELVRDALARERELTDVPAPTTIAVFPFRFEGDDPDLSPLGHALAGMVTTDLSRTNRFTVLERTHVHALMSEIELAEEGLVDPSTAARSGRLLGAGRIVQGRLGGTESRVDLDAAVVQVTATDPDVSPVRREDSLDQLFEMEKSLVLDLFETMGVTLTTAERESILERRTDNLQALLAYGQGLQESQLGNYAQAAQHFNRALALDPDFAVAQSEAEEAEQMSEAAETETAEVSVRAARDVEVPEVREAVEVVEAAVRRDPAQEVLKTEGLQRVITIEIVIKRPGGDR